MVSALFGLCSPGSKPRSSRRFHDIAVALGPFNAMRTLVKLDAGDL